MPARYVLSPQAAIDLVEIWSHLSENTGTTVADRVEGAILDQIAFVAMRPGVGHVRPDLTNLNVKFFPVYSYLIVYRPDTKPLQIAAVIHGRRDLQEILKDRL